MPAAKSGVNVEQLIGIIEQLAERVEHLEVAVGVLAAAYQGTEGSARLAPRMPELAVLLRRHEQSGRLPRTIYSREDD